MKKWLSFILVFFLGGLSFMALVMFYPLEDINRTEVENVDIDSERIASEITENYPIVAMTKDAIRSGAVLPEGASPDVGELGMQILNGEKSARKSTTKGNFFLVAEERGDLVMFDVVHIFPSERISLYSDYCMSAINTYTLALRMGVVFEKSSGGNLLGTETELANASCPDCPLNTKLIKEGLQVPTYSNEEMEIMKTSGFKEIVEENGGVLTIDIAREWVNSTRERIKTAIKESPLTNGYLFWVDGKPQFMFPII